MEIVPGLVVLAGVLQTKPNVLVESLAGTWNAKCAFALASAFCTRFGCRRARRRIRFNADVLAEARPIVCCTHARIMGGENEKTRKRNA